jgi:multidrug efflux pump
MESFYGTKYVALFGFLGAFLFIFVGIMYMVRAIQGKKVWVGQQRKTVPSKI